MSTPHPEPEKSRSRTGRQAAVRWRLWAAMLALALVPTIAGLYVTTALLSEPDPSVSAERARDASESAAALVSREQAIESRLLVAAADPAMGRLANGIRGKANKELAAQVLATLRGDDGSIVSGACIVRDDGRRIPLATRSEAADSDACASASLLRRVGQTGGSTITRSSAKSGAERLMLATPLRSVSERYQGVLSAELDVAALFDRTRLPGGDAVSSMLVDMGSSEVVAVVPPPADPVDGAATIDIVTIKPHMAGIVADSETADEELAALGIAPTIVPLWGNGDGSRMGLVQLWPEAPFELPLDLRLAIVILLAGAIFSVIVMVRYFLQPIEEMAESKAELQVLYQEAREESLNDGLTGLGNHRAFQEELTRQVAAYENSGATFSLVLMDLDDLKLVNDRDGHAAGDEMLTSMARTMRDMARHRDLLFRTGGDEFAMLLPNTEIEGAVELAERMLHFCKRPPSGERPSPFSSGVSGVPWFTRQRDMVYRQADAALYWAKRHGRGSVEVFEADRDRLPDELDDATGNAVLEVIAGKLLRPVFQPIVDLQSGRILGFEGLIRPDPRGPLPDTTRLFTAAAASGRTVELDLACIEAVVAGARAIGPDRLLTLNLSPRTLEVKDFDAGWLLSSLVRNGISPSRVIVELTERETVEDLVRLQRTFAHLQQYGLRLAADDVGAGNSGLQLLSQVQFDIVKIDLSLVQAGVRRTGSRAVIESIRDLALSQHARIVAEGVETAKQLQVIRELDIGAAQGFLLGRPNASVSQSFVDVRSLESGVVLPDQSVSAWGPADAVIAPESDDISPERRAIFLPPARRKPALETGPGTA